MLADVLDGQIVDHPVKPTTYILDFAIVFKLIEKLKESDLDQIFSIARRAHQVIYIGHQRRA